MVSVRTPVCRLHQELHAMTDIFMRFYSSSSSWSPLTSCIVYVRVGCRFHRRGQPCTASAESAVRCRVHTGGQWCSSMSVCLSVCLTHYYFRFVWLQPRDGTVADGFRSSLSVVCLFFCCSCAAQGYKDSYGPTRYSHILWTFGTFLTIFYHLYSANI